MRISFISFILAVLSFQAFAQNKRVLNNPNYDRKPVRFGFTVGFNTMDFTVRNSDNFLAKLDTVNGYVINDIYSIENNSMAGFHLGPISNFRLGEYFDFRSMIDLSFGQRNMEYILTQDTIYGESPLYKHIMKIESVFLEFPNQIKYKSKRLNNFRPYILGGINPKIDLAARKKIKEEEMPKIRLKNFDLCYELGFGIDYYFPYFKFSTEIKLSVGMFDILKHDDTQYTTAIDRLNSKMVMISFHFQ